MNYTGAELEGLVGSAVSFGLERALADAQDLDLDFEDMDDDAEEVCPISV